MHFSQSDRNSEFLSKRWALKVVRCKSNYQTDLQSGIFTALPELTHLNLSYNSLSTLDMTVMPQLSKVSSSIDCLRFITIYSLCRDYSLDLELVCASPPELKTHHGQFMTRLAVLMVTISQKKLKGL